MPLYCRRNMALINSPSYSDAKPRLGSLSYVPVPKTNRAQGGPSLNCVHAQPTNLPGCKWNE